MTTTETQTAQLAYPQAAKAQQFVSFSFYRLDPTWRRLPAPRRRRQSRELLSIVRRFSKRLMVLTYSLSGMKADVDFMIWRVGNKLEEIRETSVAISQTALGTYLTSPYIYLSATKRSTYVDKLDPSHEDKRIFITPAKSRFLFVYPFLKTRDWYRLPMEERQAMMDEHIRVGNKYPSVKLHTTYSFGLDDQEFVVAFETNEPKDFLDLVMDLRGTRASGYTLRDTPIFSCVARSFQDILKDIGG